MGIFDSLKNLNNNFFDGLKQGATDRTINKALKDAFLKNLNRGRDLIQKAKKSKLDETQIEKFEDGLDEFSKKSPDSVHDLEKFVEYFRDYVEGEIYLQNLLDNDDMLESKSDKKIKQIVEYTLKHYNQLSEHFFAAMRIVVLKQGVPTHYRFSKELEIDDLTEVEKIIEQLEAAGIITSYEINPFDPKQRKYRVNLTGIEQLETILLQLEEQLHKKR
jgi:cob(I)alamin adenosyltransferase